MASVRLLLFLLILPAHFATASQVEPFKSDLAGDQRSAFERFVYHLTVICDGQIDDIAALIPEQAVASLRDEHYAWKLERDIMCAEIARTEPGELRELHCLSEATSEYFDWRELQIGELEEAAYANQKTDAME
jgi:hypothetical protein